MSNAKGPNDSKLKKSTVRLSEPLQKKLEQIAERRPYKGNISELIRDAIRSFIDQQEDVIGSRAHFAKSMRERVDDLEKTLTIHLEDMTAQITKLILLTNLPDSTTGNTTSSTSG